MNSDWKPAVSLDLSKATPASFKTTVRQFQDWLARQPKVPIEISTGWHEITPQMAENMLANTSGNRRPRCSAVFKYARQMAEGHWRATGQTLAIDSEGNLRDGQHRLWACYLSSSAFKTFVVTDVEVSGEDDDVFAYYDIGIARTAKDTLETGGKNGLSGIVAQVVVYDFATYSNDKIRKVFVPNHTMLEFVRDNPAILDVANDVAGNLYDAADLFPVKAHAYYLAWKIYEKHGEEVYERFFEELGSDQDYEANSPIALLRAKLAEQRESLGKKSTKRSLMIALPIKAFNAWVTGQTLKALRIEPREHAFPRICDPIKEAAE